MKTSTVFLNVAKDIGDRSEGLSQQDHPSIRAIKSNLSIPDTKFEFKLVDESKVSGYLEKSD